MKAGKLLAIAGLMLSSLVVAAPCMAASKPEIDVSVSKTLKQFEMLNKSHRDLEKKAAGMLIFPKVTKGGVGVAGEYGEGVLQVNGKTVDYYSVTSASVGLTVGMAKHSEIIMFMNQETLDKFKFSKGWSIGADTGIALGKV